MAGKTAQRPSAGPTILIEASNISRLWKSARRRNLTARDKKMPKGTSKPTLAHTVIVFRVRLASMSLPSALNRGMRPNAAIKPAATTATPITTPIMPNLR
jgi:hypothetical protein